MDFGLLDVGALESVLAALEAFNGASLASAMAMTGTAHSVTPPGLELASAGATMGIQAQIAELDALNQASAANIMAYLSVSQTNKAGQLATDAAAAAAFPV